MLLTILLLNLVLPNSLTEACADAKFSPTHDSKGLENLVEELQFGLRDMEFRLGELEAKNKEMETKLESKENEMGTRLEEKNKEMETRLEAKNREMETRLQELEEKMKEGKEELEKRESRLMTEVEESLRKEFPSIDPDNALTDPSLRDLPIVLISAWHSDSLTSSQTVTFDSFLANFNNANRPDGGDGVLNLDSGLFTCFTPGYYSVSFSAHATIRPGDLPATLFLYMNDTQLPESKWYLSHNFAVDTWVGVTGSRIVILHMEAGDILELRMTAGEDIKQITLNIELIGLGFDKVV